MAGDWIKIEVTTPDKPEVHMMADHLKIDPDAVVGKLIRIWSWFDQHSENANAVSVTEALLDRVAGVKGFTLAMAFAGWILPVDEKFTLPHFDRHNGETAKKRALTAKRVAAYKQKGNANANAFSNAEVTQPTLPREEKRREDIKPNPPRLNGAFDEFWKAYPRKKSKGQAERAWLKLNPDPALAEKILSAVVGASSSNDWLREGGKFIPYPATWLNAKGWEDGETVAVAAPLRPSIVCQSCNQRTFTWTGHKCDKCWRKEMGMEAS